MFNKKRQETTMITRRRTLELTLKEQTIYDMWKKGIMNEEINDHCKIWYTELGDAPHEDRWDSIGELTIEETKDYLNDGYSIESGNVFSEEYQRLISISLPEWNDEYGGTATPEIYIPVLLIDEFDEYNLKQQLIERIDEQHKLLSI